MASSSSNNLQNMEKSLLRSNMDDAFRFIQTLFSVAATRWPQDLCSRRSQIMDSLYAPAQQQQQDHHRHHHHNKPTPTPAAEKDSSPPINKEPENKKNTKITTVCATSDTEEEEENNTTSSKLEASIDKLNARYRAAQANKRKIQVVEFQTQKKKKKNNFITELRKEAKKTIPTTKIKQFRRPRTLTSWIDGQTRRS